METAHIFLQDKKVTLSLDGPAQEPSLWVKPVVAEDWFTLIRKLNGVYAFVELQRLMHELIAILLDGGLINGLPRTIVLETNKERITKGLPRYGIIAYYGESKPSRSMLVDERTCQFFKTTNFEMLLAASGLEDISIIIDPTVVNLYR